MKTIIYPQVDFFKTRANYFVNSQRATLFGQLHFVDEKGHIHFSLTLRQYHPSRNVCCSVGNQQIKCERGYVFKFMRDCFHRIYGGEGSSFRYNDNVDHPLTKTAQRKLVNLLKEINNGESCQFGLTKREQNKIMDFGIL